MILLPSCQVLVAQMLLSGEGDTLLSLQALIGAVGMNAFTYFLPYFLEAVLSPTPISMWRKCWIGANVFLGGDSRDCTRTHAGIGLSDEHWNLCLAGLLMLAGLWSSIADLVQASHGLFSGECKLPYMYAPLSELDPCNVSGIPYRT